MNNPDQHAADLLQRGYVEYQELGRLKVWERVRHSGEQWPEALRDGTGVIERLFHSPRLINGKPDIELIVKRDKPRLGPDNTHGYWADYHTVVVTP